MKINNFRGHLTDISAKKEALVWTHLCDALNVACRYPNSRSHATAQTRRLSQKSGRSGRHLSVTLCTLATSSTNLRKCLAGAQLSGMPCDRYEIATAKENACFLGRFATGSAIVQFYLSDMGARHFDEEDLITVNMHLNAQTTSSAASSYAFCARHYLGVAAYVLRWDLGRVRSCVILCKALRASPESF